MTVATEDPICPLNCTIPVVRSVNGASAALFCVRTPAQRERLVEIRDNLIARITEAEQQGWLGEIEGLQVSLTGAESKIRQIDDSSPVPGPPVHLGLPHLAEVVSECLEKRSGRKG
ncbi:hypothetical protein OG520_04795 [Streptomyces sp. NBC_00984]|uniref:hypothetical protein n=1 Tax=Streptomyces sp. NBC_00984 TaxID=2903700 RepID=UPI003865822C|nr:hypothetical protein OG520_04795 [Streptomyces sp. NBC_00984]